MQNKREGEGSGILTYSTYISWKSTIARPIALAGAVIDLGPWLAVVFKGHCLLLLQQFHGCFVEADEVFEPVKQVGIPGN
jgi:hypothetical protein